MKFNVVLILRVVQLCLSLIVLGLSAYVVSWYTMDTLTASPSQINFLVAVPLFSLLSICYTEVTSRKLTRFYSAYVAIGLDVLNSIMYFAGFIALAVFLNSLLFCRGMVCSAARADTAFAAVAWVAWTVCAVFVAKDVFSMGFPKLGRAKAPAEMKEVVSHA